MLRKKNAENKEICFVKSGRSERQIDQQQKLEILLLNRKIFIVVSVKLCTVETA
jgi:hypothetical protein